VKVTADVKGGFEEWQILEGRWLGTDSDQGYDGIRRRRGLVSGEKDHCMN